MGQRGVDLDIALNLSTSSWLSVDSPLFSNEPWLLEKFLLEKWSAGANLEEIGFFQFDSQLEKQPVPSSVQNAPSKQGH